MKRAMKNIGALAAIFLGSVALAPASPAGSFSLVLEDPCAVVELKTCKTNGVCTTVNGKAKRCHDIIKITTDHNGNPAVIFACSDSKGRRKSRTSKL